DLVVEAGLKSGALITADFAADHGREVFAVPGSILSPASEGCNRLLRDGAAIVTTAQDVLETLQLGLLPEKQAAREILPDNPLEAAILKQLSAEPCHLDALARDLALPVATVSSTLVMMELKGMTRQSSPLHYVRVREESADYAASPTPAASSAES
ncbi:MAG TPA: DNA-processing protein DprA, partial [Anaerolineae bacterium]|nr:DNA-processing protein DprA [Anaerolineae bacterium]